MVIGHDPRVVETKHLLGNRCVVVRLIEARVESCPLVEIRRVDAKEGLFRQISLDVTDKIQGVLAMQMDVISVFPYSADASLQLALGGNYNLDSANPSPYLDG